MNPSTPLNPYQHYRKKSPVTYEEYVDPYRRNKHTPTGSSASEQDVLHSRTGSDSSTSRLATNGAPQSQFDPSSDPYAMSRLSSHFITDHNTTNTDINSIPRLDDSNQRVNSYLPYSHHDRVPTQTITPIYVEEEQHTLQGLGSMLQDNFTMDMDNERRNNKLGEKSTMAGGDDDFLQQQQLHGQHKSRHHSTSQWLRQRWYRLPRWIWLVLILLFIMTFVLLMYFLIPRMPTVKLTDTETNQYPMWSNDRSSMSAEWNVSITLDNSMNWIPTFLQKLNVVVEDYDTKAQVGYGLYDDSQWLAPHDYVITMPVHIAYSGTNASDDTLLDLSTICGLERQSVGPTSLLQSELFNITFQIDLSVRGVPWFGHTTIIPKHGIQCPS